MSQRTLKKGGDAHSPIIGWAERVSELGNPWHQCRISLAVVGDVWEIKKSAQPEGKQDDVGLFAWNARIMDDARTERFGEGPRGYAATLKDAKAIVESILYHTGTANYHETVPNTEAALRSATS